MSYLNRPRAMASVTSAEPSASCPATENISRDARNGPHQTTSQHAAHGQTDGHVGRTSFSQVKKACSRIPQKSCAPTKPTRRQSSQYCPPASRTTLSADGYSHMTMPGNGCIRSFSAPLFQMALEDGEIYTTEDRSGTALWLPATAHHEDQPGLSELYEPILGADYAKRIAAFDERSTANHPDHEDHFYLPFIAVRPQFFDQGIGTALLRDRLAALDSQGLPTYLEASNRDSARLYERLGYKRLDPTTDMPGGPSLKRSSW
jgi:ribosomal protein S18 acetylase RimI-like enzyme